MSDFIETAIQFNLRDIRQADGWDKKVYCVRFCDHIPSLWSFFAAVGSNVISVYQIQSDTNNVELVQQHIDEDYDRNNLENSEVYYSCTWASDKYGNPVVVAGGKQHLLKLINIVTFEFSVLRGHGDYINELRTHAIDSGLVFSASRDQSIRLWNIRTMTCVAIFGGEQGHRDDVVSIDIHTLGNCLASSSTDTTIKIWNLKDPLLEENILKSDILDQHPENIRFKVVIMQYPLFSTTSVHTDYIDSIRWIGDCLLSKSTNDRIVMWTPDATRYKGAPLILQEYHLDHSQIWFVKLDVSVPLGLFAVGNNQGKTLIYPIVPQSSPEANESQTTRARRERFQNREACDPLVVLSHSKFPNIVRQTSFSSDGRYLVCGLEGQGNIQVWEIEPTTKLL